MYCNGAVNNEMTSTSFKANHVTAFAVFYAMVALVSRGEVGMDSGRLRGAGCLIGLKK